MIKCTFEEIVKLELAVACNILKDAIKLLNFYHNKGVTWSNGSSLLENTRWNTYGPSTAYVIRKRGDGSLSLGYAEYSDFNSVSIVNFDQVVIEEEVKINKVIIQITSIEDETDLYLYLFSGKINNKEAFLDEIYAMSLKYIDDYEEGIVDCDFISWLDEWLIPRNIVVTRFHPPIIEL